MEDYLDYGFVDIQAQGGFSDSGFDVDDLVSELVEDRESVIEILEKQIEEIESEIGDVGEVYESNASKLSETIRKQSDRLRRAQNSSALDEEEVRDRLARLYRELRQERREELENRLELKMRKWNLERELDELEDSDLSV